MFSARCLPCLCSRQGAVRRMLQAALAVPAQRGRQSVSHGHIARAMGCGGLRGVLSRQLGASGFQGGQRGVGGWQDVVV